MFSPSYFGRGYFCPVCLRIYHDDETDSPMVCCDSCDRWIHTGKAGLNFEWSVRVPGVVATNLEPVVSFTRPESLLSGKSGRKKVHYFKT